MASMQLTSHDKLQHLPDAPEHVGLALGAQLKYHTSIIRTSRTCGNVDNCSGDIVVCMPFSWLTAAAVRRFVNEPRIHHTWPTTCALTHAHAQTHKYMLSSRTANVAGVSRPNVSCKSGPKLP